MTGTVATGGGPDAEGRIALVVSDVDGTLVTHEKRLTDATRAAVGRLAEHGIGFTVTSSRPPFGLRSVIRDLDLRLPIGAFNGGAIVQPDLTEIESHFLPREVARDAIDQLTSEGVGVWVFADGRWLLRDLEGDYVARERHTIETEPTPVRDFEDVLARVGKIVGASRDEPRLAACEGVLRTALGGGASVSLSQPYYLDVTPAGIDKGTFLTALSRLTSIPLAAMAVLGDMDNDVPMLRAGGLAIAMGNGSPAAKAAAAHLTASNEDDGAAQAIDRLIIRGRSRAGGDRGGTGS